MSGSVDLVQRKKYIPQVISLQLLICSFEVASFILVKPDKKGTFALFDQIRIHNLDLYFMVLDPHDFIFTLNY